MRLMMKCVAGMVLLFGCASATEQTQFGHGNPDAPPGKVYNDAPKQFFDAPPVQQMDAPPAHGNLTITATGGNTTINYGGSVACSDQLSGNTRDNIWYRGYQLSDYPQVTGNFHVTSVTFGVQEASASSAITVKIGTYAGTLDGTTINSAQITPLAMGTGTPPNTTGMTGETVNVQLTTDIPAGSKLIVQVVAPDMQNTGYMYIGATSHAETHKGYISSSACSVSTPETTTAANASASQLIIDVTGTY